MSSSGSRELLEAARKRLASAKSQVSAATKNMKAVMASAQTMCDAADKEYKEANAALEEAEKKYEVIDIDADDLGNSGQEGINKRKKTLANSSPTSVAISSFPREVTVVGCGLPEVNGIYLKEDDGDNFPTYKKQGMWKRQSNVTKIFKLTGPPQGGLWFISYGLISSSGAESDDCLCLYYSNAGCSVPPKDGWESYSSECGQHTVPKLTY